MKLLYMNEHYWTESNCVTAIGRPSTVHFDTSNAVDIVKKLTEITPTTASIGLQKHSNLIA